MLRSKEVPGGHVYDPHSGSTYNVEAKLEGDGSIRARIFKGVTLFGETKTLVRVQRAHSYGWC